jgi:hypothetical protein
MSWSKLLLEAVSRVLPPAAEWLVSRFQNGNSSSSSAKPNSSAEANRHGTQSGSARNASSDATEKMMREPKCPKCGLPQSKCDEIRRDHETMPDPFI